MTLAYSIAPAIAPAIASPLGVTAGSVPLPLPLPANAFELWCGEYGASSAAAVGLLRGLSLAGVNSPTVGVVPGMFGGRPVYQSSVSGPKGWSTTFATDLLPASEAQTWVYVVGQFRTGVGAADQWIVDVGRSFSGGVASVNLSSTNLFRLTVAGAAPAPNGFGDTAPHRFRGFKDGAAKPRFAVDGSETLGGASTAGNMIAINAVGIGVPCGAWGQGADANIALVLVCRGEPTALAIAALDSWAIDYYQMPDTPETILRSKCKLWLGGSMQMGIGTRVAQLNDQSGYNAHHVQGTFATQPTRVENALGTQPTARFSGTQHLTTANAIQGLLTGDQPELFVVKRMSASTGSMGTVLNANGQQITLQRDTAPNKNYDLGGTRLTFADASDGAYELLRLQASPSLVANRNGVQIGSAPQSPALSADVVSSVVGAYSSAGATPFIGDIADLVIANPAPSGSELTRLNAYFNAKYPSLPHTISSVLAGLGAAARGWWTVFDPGLTTMPGISITGTVGVDAVVDSWTDQLRGFVLSATGANRPDMNADSTNFGARPVIQCAITGVKCLRATTGLGASFLAAGERPYILMCFRYRAVTGTFPTAIAIGTATVDQITLAVSGTKLRTYNAPSTVVNSAADVGTTVHTVATWLDGTSLHQTMDRASGLAADASSLPANVDRLALGTGVTTDAVIANASIAEVIVLNGYPGASVDLLLRTLVAAKYA